jgi:hypothetical protein
VIGPGPSGQLTQPSARGGRLAKVRAVRRRALQAVTCQAHERHTDIRVCRGGHTHTSLREGCMAEKERESGGSTALFTPRLPGVVQRRE